MSEITAADCQSCGACCIANSDDCQYVELTEEDVAGFSSYYQRTKVIREVMKGALTGFDRFALATKKNALTGDTVCCALAGAPGVTRVRCTIYERRPGVCRSFMPGSRECIEARSEIANRLEV